MLGVSFPGRLGRRARVRASAHTRKVRGAKVGGHSALPASPAPGSGRKRVCVSRRETEKMLIFP